MRYAEIVFGNDGLTSDENPRRVPHTALIEAYGIAIEDGVIRKEGGAEVYDAAGIAGSPFYSGTLSVAANWGAVMGTFPGAGIAAGGTAVADTRDSSAGSTFTLSAPVGGYAINSLVTVSVITAGTIEADSVTDVRGNTYVSVGRVGHAGGFSVKLFASRLTTGLIAGDAVTILYDGAFHLTSSTAAATMANFTGVSTATKDRLATSTGNLVTAVTCGPTQSLPTVPQLVVVAIGAGVAPATGSFAPSAGFTEAIETTVGASPLPDSTTHFRIDTTTPTLIAIHDWWPTSDVQRIVSATIEGSLLKDDGAGNLDATTLKGGLSTTARPGKFVEGGKEVAANNRKLFYFNGANIVQVLSGNGATTSDISAPPADWSGSNQPINGIIHRNRLIGFGNLNAPHTIYFSLPGNHEDFTTTPLSYNCYPSTGDRLVAAAGYQGLLWLFKFPRGIYWLDDSDVSVANWIAQKRTDAIGVVQSPYAALEIDNDIMFLTADGSFHLLSAVEQGITRDSDLTVALRLQKWMREHINFSRLNQAISKWYPYKKRAIWALPGINDTQNTIRMEFDFSDVQQGGRVKFMWSNRDSLDGLALRREADTIERPMIGQGGHVFFLDRTTKSKGGESYFSTVQLQHLDMSHLAEKYGALRKVWRELIIVQNAAATDYSHTLAIYQDRTLVEDTIAVKANARRVRYPLHGTSHEISFALDNFGNAPEDFALLRLLIGFDDGDEGPL